jgi:hypothetical protein
VLTRIDATRRSLARRDRTGILHDLPTSAGTFRAAWDGSYVEWRRRPLVAVVEHVKVPPAVKGRNFFDPDRVEIVWCA